MAQGIALIEVNDGTKKGMVYDKTAYRIFIDCGGNTNAQIFVKRKSNEKYDDNPPVYAANMIKAEIEIKPESVIPNGTTDGKPYLAQNGVLQIYQPANRIPIWVLGSGSWSDRTEKFGSKSGSGDKTVVSFSDQTRATVKCKKGAGDGTQDLGKALKDGYSDSIDDFVNIEQTGYAEVTKEASEKGDQDLVWYGPTGRHTGKMEDNLDDKRGCMGSTYKSAVHYIQGKARMAKEVWHVNYDYKEWEGVGETAKSKKGKRIGIKWVNFLVEKSGRKVRHLELWHDIEGIKEGKPGNKWKLVYLAEDDDHDTKWGNDRKSGENMKLCGCPSDTEVISWGAPGVTYRADNTGWELSFATVAEIVPPEKLHEAGNVVEPT